MYHPVVMIEIRGQKYTKDELIRDMRSRAGQLLTDRGMVWRTNWLSSFLMRHGCEAPFKIVGTLHPRFMGGRVSMNEYVYKAGNRKVNTGLLSTSADPLDNSPSNTLFLYAEGFDQLFMLGLAEAFTRKITPLQRTLFYQVDSHLQPAGDIDYLIYEDMLVQLERKTPFVPFGAHRTLPARP